MVRLMTLYKFYIGFSDEHCGHNNLLHGQSKKNIPYRMSLGYSRSFGFEVGGEAT